MKIKKAVSFILIPCILGVGGTAGYRYYQKRRFEKIVVDVTPVEQFTTYDWGSSTSVGGMISNKLRQEIYLTSMQKVNRILVKEGQKVSIGTPIIELDATQLEIDLEDMRIQLEQKRLDISDGIKRLNKLMNTAPYSPGGWEDPGYWDDPWFWDDPWYEDPPEEPGAEESSEEESSEEETSEEESSAEESFEEESSEEESSEEESSEEETSEEESSAEESFEEESSVEESSMEESSAEETSEEESLEERPTTAAGEELICDVIVETKQAQKGCGSKEDPYIFQCGSEAGLRLSLLGDLAKEEAYAQIWVYDERGIRSYILDLSLVVVMDENGEIPSEEETSEPASESAPQESSDPTTPSESQPSSSETVPPSSDSVPSSEPQPSSEVVQPQPEPTTESQVSTEPTTESQVSTEPTTESQTPTEPTTESQVSTEPATESQASTEMTTESQTSTEVTTESQTSTEAAVTETAAETQPVTEPTTEPTQPAAVPEPATEPTQPVTVPEPVPEPATTVQTEAQPQPEPGTSLAEPVSSDGMQANAGLWEGRLMRFFADADTLNGMDESREGTVELVSVLTGLRSAAGIEKDISIPSQEEESFEYYTAEELKQAIHEQELSLRDMDLERRKMELQYAIKQNELAETTVCSYVEGVVGELQDPGDPDYGRPFTVIDGGDGYYLTGTVGELYLDQFRPGSILFCEGWSENGMVSCEAVVTELSDYPADGENSYYGSGNPNVSYYPFTAYIEEAEGLEDGMYLDVTVNIQGDTEAFFLDRMYIRSEGGRDYVWAANRETGLLEKRYVRLGKLLYDSYYEIKGGLALDDLIAEPFGSDIKEGVKTKNTMGEPDIPDESEPLFQEDADV